jgi:hypothetical protein
MLTKKQSTIQSTNFISTTSSKQTYEAIQNCQGEITPQIVAVEGVAGVGKSTVIDHVLYHTHLFPFPSALVLSVPSSPTQLSLMSLILEPLDEKRHGQQIEDNIDWVVKALARNETRLLVFDDTNRLDKELWRLALNIQAQAKCHMVFVGLPGLANKIRKLLPPADERELTPVRFTEPSIDEVLELILPNLVIKQWSFNPDSESDRELGIYLWHRVRPSLQHSVTVIRLAQAIAKRNNTTGITQANIDEALGYTRRRA